jgi:peptide/nickel transport system substrate-binding protein
MVKKTKENLSISFLLRSYNTVTLKIPVLLLLVVSFSCGCRGETVLKIGNPFGPSEVTPDPARGSNGWYLCEAGVLETLFELDTNFNIIPLLARRWENISPCEWKIVLKTDVLFHDMSLMNAQSVKWSINRLTGKKSAVYNGRVRSMLNIRDISIENDSTLIFTTAAPNSSFIYNLVSPGVGIISTKSNDRAIYATGPFKIRNVVPDEKMVVQKFPEYHRGVPNVDVAIINIIKHPVTRILAFNSGQIDIALNYAENNLPNIRKSGDKAISCHPTARLCFFFVRVKDGPLSDRAVRRALNYAIDRRAIVETILWKTGGVVSKSIFSPVLPWHNSDLAPYVYDPQETMRILDSCGIRDTDGDGIREKDGVDFTIDMWTYEGRSALKPTLELVQEFFRKVGIAAVIQVTQKGSAINREMQLGKVELNLQMWNVAPNGSPEFFIKRILTSDAPCNYMGYRNIQIDSLVKKAETTFDFKEKKSLIDEIQKIIYDESPLIVLFHKSIVSAYYKNIVHFRAHPAEKKVVTHRIQKTSGR